MHPHWKLAVPINTEFGSTPNESEAINDGGNRIDAELKELGAKQLSRKVVEQRTAAVESWATRLRRNRTTIELPPPPPLPSASAPKSTQAYRAAAKKVDTTLNDEDYEDEDQDTDEIKKQTMTKGCRCTNQSSDFLALVLDGYEKYTKLNDRERVKVINAWYREVCVNRAGRSSQLNTNRVCWLHTRATATCMGLFKRAMNAAFINKILTLLYLS
ncbi:hypothetical protein BKA58DRAFT_435191 [Alternaria rosae]|uniref:uncharacterized protein n=1 Tax=Alternaria rosae TaxID=1187941 RepID=UPI001E8D5BB4|nr:uncharacterized protein BKA58DRAFT_435191 [Alternaria rosae]KAH6877451.1 hypothetical protein BKA58DRAFT_435191 [Alternaria rosae]